MYAFKINLIQDEFKRVIEVDIELNIRYGKTEKTEKGELATLPSIPDE